MDCKGCPKRKVCQIPCPEIEAQLPKEWQGRLEGAYRPGAVKYLKRLDQARREVRLMLDHRDVLKGRQREVFEMTYIDGLTHREIADRLRIQRRVAGTYLARAHETLAKAIVGPRRKPRGV